MIELLDHIDRLQRTDVTNLEGLYRALSLTVGRRVRVHTVDGQIVEGNADDVSSAGVHVVDDMGLLRIFSSADVEHLRTS